MKSFLCDMIVNLALVEVLLERVVIGSLTYDRACCFSDVLALY